MFSATKKGEKIVVVVVTGTVTELRALLCAVDVQKTKNNKIIQVEGT